jgi:hypothetical protein
MPIEIWNYPIVYQASGYGVLRLKKQLTKYRFLADPGALLFQLQGPLAGIKNVRNFTQAGLLIFIYYLKAHGLCLFVNCNKTL